MPAAYEDLTTTLEALAAAPSLWNTDRARQAAPAQWESGEHVPPSIARRGPILRPVTTCARGRPRLKVPARPLGGRALAAAHRRPSSGPGTHQAAVHTVLRSCALAGWTYSEAADFAGDAERSPALEWLRTSSSTGGRRIRLEEAEAARRLTRAWWLAVQDAARLPRRPAESDEPSEAAAAAADLLARIAAAGPAPWRRPSGPADLAILRAIAWLMTTSGSCEVSADVRRLAVLAGYSPSTAALSLTRVGRDGWIETAKDADPGSATARRIRLARTHECTTDAHHMCAVYTADDEAPAPHRSAEECADQYGSDRRRNAAPPAGPRRVLTRLKDLIAHQQAGLWHVLGHHAARTLRALEDHLGHTEASREQTGYTARTHARHIAHLLSLGLVDVDNTGQLHRTARSLHEAGTTTCTATRPAELAAVARVEVAVYRWWQREEAWCRLSRRDKRRRGRRAPAHQLVVPGTDPHARAYPRHPGTDGTPDRGPADHRTAWAIEAQRIRAADLALHADRLAQLGEVIDPAHLSTPDPVLTRTPLAA